MKKYLKEVKASDDTSIPIEKEINNILQMFYHHKINISIKQWRLRIIINETTTKELINTICLKLKKSFDDINIINYNNSEFTLKVVGCENRYIISYEAVRKAVRNEDNVKFQLLYFSNFKQIEKDCFNKNMHHISKYIKQNISECNLLRTGKYSLNYYKGPKCDTYENLSFKYCGTAIDRHLKQYNNNNNKELQNVFKLGIEFKQKYVKIIIHVV